MNQIAEYYTKIIFIIGDENKVKLLYLLSLLLVLGLLEMFGIGLLIPVISMATDFELIHNNKFLSYLYNIFAFKTNVSFFIFFSTALIFVYVLKIAYSIYVSKINFRFAYNILEYTTLKLTKSYMKKDYEYFLSNDVSKLIKNTTAEVGNFATGVIVYSMAIIVDIIMITFISLFLFYINPMLFLYVILFVVIVFGGIYLTVFKKIKNLGEVREDAQRLTYKTCSDIFNSIQNIKVNDKYDLFLSSLTTNIQNYKKSGITFEILRSVPKYIVDGIIFISIISIILIIILLDINTKLILPTIGVYVLGILKVLPALNRIISTSMTIKFYLPTVNLIYNELKENEINEKRAINNQKIDFDNKVNISNLSFNYNNTQNKSLDNINLDIHKNSSIAFVGHSGSGKSTLINILLGLFNNYGGKITIDEKDIQDNIKVYQDIIGYVPQDIFLLNESVAFNISLEFEDSKIDYVKLNDILKIVDLEDVVQNMDDGINTSVGEKGMKFSGGQIQRIGIARALYKEPQILIFDESTSALDNKTEKKIMSEINKMKNKVTIIMIAHRLSTVELCDEIFVMNNGKIVESGSFESLVNNKGYFYEHIYKHGQKL